MIRVADVVVVRHCLARRDRLVLDGRVVGGHALEPEGRVDPHDEAATRAPEGLDVDVLDDHAL